MALTASLVVNFGAGAAVGIGASLQAELDDVLNNDKSSFLPTETAYFVIYKYPSSVIVEKPIPSSGMVVAKGSVTRTKTQTLEFTNGSTASLSYPPSGSVIVKRWYGNEGQGFAVSGMSASISSLDPCVCEVEYQTSGASWELLPPTIDIEETPEWPIIVFIQGQEA